MDESVKRYELSGGSSVTLLKPFGSTTYAALVEQRGRYPELGMRARNRNRREFLYLLEGEVSVQCAGKSTPLGRTAGVLLNEDEPYSIEGQGRVLVVVTDQPGAATELVPEQE